MERASVSQWLDGWVEAEKPTLHFHYELWLRMPVGMWKPCSWGNVSFAEVLGVPCTGKAVSKGRHGECGSLTSPQGCHPHQQLGWRGYGMLAHSHSCPAAFIVQLIFITNEWWHFLLWRPERQSHAGSLLLKASHWRPSSLGSQHSWRLSVCAGMEIVHFLARNLQKWRQFCFLKGAGLSPAEGRTRIEVTLSRGRDVCEPVCM